MKIINIGVLAHVDAGKTTLTESLLYNSGAITELGSVDKGTTRTDNTLLERQRGITIQTGITSFQWENTKVNIIDTPGHMDFLAEVYRSLSVLDGAILLISAKDGVQAQTRILFHALRKMGIPTIFFINKIDQNGIDLSTVYQDRLSVTTVPNFVCATWTKNLEPVQFLVSPEVWLEQFWVRLDDPFANFLGPGYKYWGALATACGLCPHIRHSDEPIEPALVVNGPQAGRRIQSL